jgi:mRNA interferase RelE/StbE
METIADYLAANYSLATQAIYQLAFEEIPNVDNLSEIPNLIKLKGYGNAYRIRVGNYRIGFFIDNETIQQVKFCPLC